MKTEINKKFGKRIQYLRLQKGLSQNQLAEKIGIATTSLSYVETGRGFMTLSTLEKLSNVLNVELYEIFQFSTITSNIDMYEYIQQKLSLIKNNDEKIRLLYYLVKNFF